MLNSKIQIIKPLEESSKEHHKHGCDRDSMSVIVSCGSACWQDMPKKQMQEVPKVSSWTGFMQAWSHIQNFNLSTLVAEAGISLRVHNQPGLHSKF